MNLAMLEESTQKYDTTAIKDHWMSGQEPTGDYYVTGGTCLDCGKDDFTVQELADLIVMPVYKNQPPPMAAQPRP